MKVGDLVRLISNWRRVGIVTEVCLSNKGIDESFVEVLWFGVSYRYLERIDNLEVISEKRLFGED